MLHAAIQTPFTIARSVVKTEGIPLSDLRTHEMTEVLAIWRAHRNGREMPARNDLVPRTMGRYLRNISLIRVLQLEQDYEFRIVGDAHVEAYDMRNYGRRVSKLVLEAPEFANSLKTTLDLAVKERTPFAYRVVFDKDNNNPCFSRLETLYAPMANTNGPVDYILNACAYDMRSDA